MLNPNDAPCRRVRWSGSSCSGRSRFLKRPRSVGLLRHWAAQTHAPQLILGARADVTGVEYLIRSQLRHKAAVRRAVEQLVDGAIVTSSASTDREHAATARRIQLSTNARQLEPVDAVASQRSILHALTAVGKGERLTIQLVLAPASTPKSSPPNRSGTTS